MQVARDTPQTLDPWILQCLALESLQRSRPSPDPCSTPRHSWETRSKPSAGSSRCGHTHYIFDVAYNYTIQIAKNMRMHDSMPNGYVYKHVCMHACMYVHTYVYTYIYIYIYIYTDVGIDKGLDIDKHMCTKDIHLDMGTDIWNRR